MEESSDAGLTSSPHLTTAILYCVGYGDTLDGRRLNTPTAMVCIRLEVGFLGCLVTLALLSPPPLPSPFVPSEKLMSLSHCVTFVSMTSARRHRSAALSRTTWPARYSTRCPRPARPGDPRHADDACQYVLMGRGGVGDQKTYGENRTIKTSGTTTRALRRPAVGINRFYWPEVSVFGPLPVQCY